MEHKQGKKEDDIGEEEQEGLDPPLPRRRRGRGRTRFVVHGRPVRGLGSQRPAARAGGIGGRPGVVPAPQKGAEEAGRYEGEGRGGKPRRGVRVEGP